MCIFIRTFITITCHPRRSQPTLNGRTDTFLIFSGVSSVKGSRLAVTPFLSCQRSPPRDRLISFRSRFADGAFSMGEKNSLPCRNMARRHSRGRKFLANRHNEGERRNSVGQGSSLLVYIEGSPFFPFLIKPPTDLIVPEPDSDKKHLGDPTRCLSFKTGA